jgi:hypothetical protein
MSPELGFVDPLLQCLAVLLTSWLAHGVVILESTGSDIAECLGGLCMMRLLVRGFESRGIFCHVGLYVCS